MLTLPAASWWQCPTDVEPTGVGWTPGGPQAYPIPGTNCTFQVYYCLRIFTEPGINDDNTTCQIYITKIVPNGNNDCGDYTPEQLISFAVQDIMNDPRIWTLMPGCTTYWTAYYGVVFAAQCWYTPTPPQPASEGGTKTARWAAPNSNTGWLYAELDPCTTGAYCEKSCEMCLETSTGPVVQTNCSTTTIGTAHCQDEVYPWYAGTCYFVGCDRY